MLPIYLSPAAESHIDIQKCVEFFPQSGYNTHATLHTHGTRFPQRAAMSRMLLHRLGFACIFLFLEETETKSRQQKGKGNITIQSICGF